MVNKHWLQYRKRINYKNLFFCSYLSFSSPGSIFDLHTHTYKYTNHRYYLMNLFPFEMVTRV